MPSFAFAAPLKIGQCATPIALSTGESTIDFQLSGSTVVTGKTHVILTCSVDWFYTDTPASGRLLFIKAGQPLTIPLYDGLIIGATGSAVGSLGAMIAGDR